MEKKYTRAVAIVRVHERCDYPDVAETPTMQMPPNAYRKVPLTPPHCFSFRPPLPLDSLPSFSDLVLLPTGTPRMLPPGVRAK